MASTLICAIKYTSTGLMLLSIEVVIAFANALFTSVMHTYPGLEIALLILTVLLKAFRFLRDPHSPFHVGNRSVDSLDDHDKVGLQNKIHKILVMAAFMQWAYAYTHARSLDQCSENFIWCGRNMTLSLVAIGFYVIQEFADTIKSKFKTIEDHFVMLMLGNVIFSIVTLWNICPRHRHGMQTCVTMYFSGPLTPCETSQCHLTPNCLNTYLEQGRKGIFKPVPPPT